uniref:RING-type E3 ubiquitin transferase n=2 Tax=Dendroctonus ponderosae TaxID=77166 RepID=A0AAR5P946_DENPD
MAESKMQTIKRNIPFKIWHRQNCSSCCQVLSVGYVMISSEVEHVCGRCITLLEYRNYEFAKSLYNIVASEYSFSCMNCYFGCDQSFSIFNMLPHESSCPRISEEPFEQRCELCEFKGDQTYDMVTHARKYHLKEGLFEGAKILFSTVVDVYMKKLFFLEDGIFVMQWDYDSPTMNLRINIDCISVVKPRRFTVRIERPDDPTNHIVLQADSIDVVGVEFNENYDEFNEEFGFGTVLSYELIVENLPYDEIDQLTIIRFIEVYEKEEVTVNTYNIGKAKMKALDDRNKKYNMILDILKYLAPNLLKCSNCYIINPGMKLFVCSEGHICCRVCIHPKCEACKGPREFNVLDELKNLLVRCDWPGCKFDTKLHSLMSHKATCSRRPYLCPLKGCYKSFTSIKELSDHWHACTPSLIESDCSITFNKGTHQEVFWVFNHDIYRVLVKINEEIEVIIEDFDVVLVNNRIYCYGIRNNVKEEITSRVFCDYFRVSIDNRRKKNPAYLAYEQIQIEIIKKNM